jgi:hypothetical protein
VGSLTSYSTVLVRRLLAVHLSHSTVLLLRVVHLLLILQVPTFLSTVADPTSAHLYYTRARLFLTFFFSESASFSSKVLPLVCTFFFFSFLESVSFSSKVLRLVSFFSSSNPYP